jgi:DNA-binding XRE family transcriptional regulator
VNELSTTPPASGVSTLDIELVLAQIAALETTTQRGDAFEVLSDYALLHHEDFAGKIERIEPYRRWAARETPGVAASQRRDLGVDRIVTTHSGQHWAVQNKGLSRASAKSGFSEYTNFLVQSSTIPRLEKRLWITSGAGLTGPADDHNLANRLAVTVLNREWLTGAGPFPVDVLAAIRTAADREGPGMPVKLEGPADLAAALQRARERAGINQRDMGRVIGASQKFIWELEGAKGLIHIERIFAFCRAAGVRLVMESADEDIPAAPNAGAKVSDSAT